MNKTGYEELALDMLREHSDTIDFYLNKKYCDEKTGGRACEKLYRAEKYSLMAGGKRIRPALVLEVCRIFGGETEAALPFAAAVEMIHTYSLIHDDLPCMDNDDMRRGRPANHVAFGEDYALLAGDGLLTDAFYECAMNPFVSGDCAALAAGILSKAAGSYGMVKGQAMDMYGEDNRISLEELVELYAGKTGALICVAAQLGAFAAGVPADDEKMKDVTAFAQRIGLVFQIVDDILDVTSTVEELGKNPGKDSENHKTTFMSFYDIPEAMDFARSNTCEAVKIMEKYSGSEKLCALAEYLCNRKK